MRDQAAAELRALYETVERLRAPGGCPWDRAQSHRSLRSYLLEETYETLEAIENGDDVELREELGDLLLQVFMHSTIAAERPGGFDIGDVAATTRAKMVNRHPHVFGDASVAGADEVVVNWERLKARERGPRLSILDGVPVSLPALAYALGVQKRPARLGFDETADAEAALGRLRDALDAAGAVSSGRPGAVLAEPVVDPTVSPLSTESAGAGAGSARGHAPGAPPASPQLEALIGELLFAAVSLARRLRVDPEDALRARAVAFAARFRRLEAAARADGVDLHDLGAEAWRSRWEAAAEPVGPSAHAEPD